MNIRNKHSDSNNSLADATAATTLARAVIGRLGGKGRKPQDDEEAIDTEHDVWVGESTSTLESRGHDKIDPSGDGEEALRKGEGQTSATESFFAM